MGYLRKSVTIANGASLSGVVLVPGGYALCGLELPTITSAAISFQAATTSESTDSSNTYRDMYKADGTTENSVGASTGARYVALDPTLFRGARKMKIRSGLTGAAVNQGADRTIGLVFTDAY